MKKESGDDISAKVSREGKPKRVEKLCVSRCKYECSILKCVRSDVHAMSSVFCLLSCNEAPQQRPSSLSNYDPQDNLIPICASLWPSFHE